MYHISHSIKDIQELEKIISLESILSLKNYRSLLIQIYSANTDQDWLEKIRQIISDKFPQAIIVGATTVGEVIFGKTYTNSTVIGFSAFESSTLSIICKECLDAEEIQVGKYFAQEINSMDGEIAGILLLSTPLSIDAAKLLRGLESSRLEYPVFGGGAGDYASMENSLVFSNQWVSSNGAIAVIFQGTELHIDSRTYLGWRPLSKQMTITEAEGMLVKTIDHRPAFEIYERYLGLPYDENFFLNVLEFPFLIQRDGDELARVPVFVTKEGAIQFVADIHVGETFRIGYGDPNLIISDSFDMHNFVQTLEPEAIFLYTCGCRRFLMQEDVELETAPFEKIASTFGFYTYGEFFGTLSNAQLLNSTMVVVSFREGDQKKKSKFQSNLLDKKNETTQDPYFQKHGRIISRLVHFVEAVTSELAEKNKELEQLYVTDRLTGLYNRHKLDEVLITELDRVKRYEHSLGIIILDIDHFKHINDSYGHQKGDYALQKIAQIVKNHARKIDIVGRWGGEEFLVVSPETDQVGLKILAEKLRNEIELFHFDDIGTQTASFGLTVYQKGDLVDQMILRADNALYKAKENGRNRVELL